MSYPVKLKTYLETRIFQENTTQGVHLPPEVVKKREVSNRYEVLACAGLTDALYKRICKKRVNKCLSLLKGLVVGFGRKFRIREVPGSIRILKVSYYHVRSRCMTGHNLKIFYNNRTPTRRHITHNRWKINKTLLRCDTKQNFSWDTKQISLRYTKSVRNVFDTEKYSDINNCLNRIYPIIKTLTVHMNLGLPRIYIFLFVKPRCDVR